MFFYTRNVIYERRTCSVKNILILLTWFSMFISKQDAKNFAIYMAQNGNDITHVLQGDKTLIFTTTKNVTQLMRS